jgi:hypothetical protein
LGFPPSFAVVPLSEPDVPGVPAAAASPPLEALPLVATPLAAPPLVAPLDELPLAKPPLVVATPVLPAEPEGPTDPDEPDDGPPEDEPLPPGDPEPAVIEGVFELEHARLNVTPPKNNPERHLADMRPPQRKLQVKTGEARLTAESEDTNTMFFGARDEGQCTRVGAASRLE